MTSLPSLENYLLLQLLILCHTLSLMNLNVAFLMRLIIDGNPRYLRVRRTARTPKILVMDILLQRFLDIPTINDYRFRKADSYPWKLFTLVMTIIRNYFFRNQIDKILQNDYYAHKIKEILSFNKDDYKISLDFNFYKLLVDIYSFA